MRPIFLPSNQPERPEECEACSLKLFRCLFFAAQRRLAVTLASLGLCVGLCVHVCVCLIWTHPARSDGRDATSWRPGRPGTQRRRRPSAPPAGSAGDAPRSRGRRSRCSEGSLQFTTPPGSQHCCCAFTSVLNYQVCTLLSWCVLKD